jgi:hypothetical protein
LRHFAEFSGEFRNQALSGCFGLKFERSVKQLREPKNIGFARIGAHCTCEDARGFGMTELNDSRINQEPGTLALTGSFANCQNDAGLFDMVGNLHEWTSDPNGTFEGGFYLDTHEHGDGCAYRTIAHGADYHDYSTGFRCCANPTASPVPLPTVLAP